MTAPEPPVNSPSGAPASGPEARGGLARAAAVLAAHVADRSAPLAEFACGAGEGGLALARAGFACIDGFDPSADALAAAARTGAYRRLARAELSGLPEIAPGAYANAAVMHRLDPARLSPQLIDELLALLPSGGCLVFSLPGAGASVGPFRARVIELCEHFVAEPVFRASEPPAPGSQDPGLQSTVYVLRKR